MTEVRVRRYDLAAGEALAPPQRLANGSWVVEGFATRAGIFKYQNPDGSMRYELRDPEEVSATAPQLAYVYLTNDHPREGLVTPANAAAFTRGYVLESSWQPEGQKVAVKCLVSHQDLLDSLAGGKCELSCGYECEVIPEEGEFKGERYTHRQRKVIYNHLAVVDLGRAGPDCALRLDSAGNVVSPVDSEQTATSDVGEIPKREPPPLGGSEENPVEKEITINGTTFKVPAALAEAYLAEQARMQEEIAKAKAGAAAMETDAKAKEAEVQQMSAKLDSANAKISSLEKLHADAQSPAKVSERVAERLKLERAVLPVLGKNYKYDAASDQQLKLDALEKLIPAENKTLREKLQDAVKKEQAAYITALFDSEVSRRADSDAGLEDIDAGGAPPPPPAPPKSAAQTILERQRERLKPRS